MKLPVEVSMFSYFLNILIAWELSISSFAYLSIHDPVCGFFIQSLFCHSCYPLFGCLPPCYIYPDSPVPCHNKTLSSTFQLYWALTSWILMMKYQKAFAPCPAYCSSLFIIISPSYRKSYLICPTPNSNSQFCAHSIPARYPHLSVSQSRH